MDPRIDTLLDGRYRLLGKIGAGGRSVVYRARHEEMGRSVAVKFLGGRSDAQALERFRREGRAAGLLNHPFVVTVHDFRVSTEGDPYLVMELCEAGSLADELAATGRPPFARTAEVMECVAAAIAAAHRAGIVHRDLKPANVLVTATGVKVADFGLATLAEEHDPSPGLTGEHAVGSPHYMSPEQCEGRTADALSDQYSLGVIAYEMLTGELPFDAETIGGVLVKHLTLDARPPVLLDPAVPRAASDAVLRALAKEPKSRFPSVTDFAETLTRALRSVSSDVARRASTKPVRSVTTLETATADAVAPLPAGDGAERTQTLAPAARDAEPGPIARDSQLREMNRRLLEALRGRGGCVLIAGEAGTGKTTLVNAFLLNELKARPEILAVTGRCSEHFGSAEAYLPFLEVVSRLASSLERGRVARFLATLAPTWLAQLPASLRSGLPEALEESAPAPAQERMPRELADFLAVLTTIRPLILVLEDVHWADKSSVDLLGYLASRVTEMRLLVVASYRPSELELQRHPLRAALRSFSSSSSVSGEVVPVPFSTADVEAFLVRELAAAVDPDVVRFVHRKTEGNPLFVVNFVRHLRETGALRVENGRAAAARPLSEIGDEVPEGVTGLVLSQLERLDEEDRRLLQLASVMGDAFDAHAVATLLSSGSARSVGDVEIDVEERLDRLHRVHRLVEPADELELPDGTPTAGYRFVHVFYQDTLYAGILPRRRMLWHQAVGDLLAARHEKAPGDVAATLAVHFERGREFAKAVAAYERAAENVARRNPREAGPLFRRALELSERLPEEVRRRERARLLVRFGRHDGEVAELVGDPSLYERSSSAVLEALAMEPDGPHAPEARTTLGLVHLERGENEKALADFRAVVAAWPAHAPARAGLAYLFKNTGLWERSLAEQEAAGALDARLAHSIPRLSVLLYQGRRDEALAESDALIAERPKYGHFRYWKGIVRYYRGERDLAREEIEHGFSLDPDNFIAKGVRAFILAVFGEKEEAERLLAAAERGAAADGTFTYWIAKARAQLGAHETAVAWIGRAEALGYWNAPWIAVDEALAPLQGLASFRERLASVRARHERFRALVEGAASGA